MAAALLRLLPRRRAATVLAALSPASMPSYSKPPNPLRAVTAAGVLPDVRRAQLCATSSVPSMLRLYATEGCARPAPPRQPAHHQATRRLPKARASISTILSGSRHMQVSHLLAPSLMRQFSSTGRQNNQHSAIMLWVMDKVMEHLMDQTETMDEALETLEVAVKLLKRGLDDNAFFLFDQGMDAFLEAIGICEGLLGYYVTAIGCCEDFTPATLEHHRLLCKEVGDRIKMLRQRLKKLSASFETLKTLRKHAKESIVPVPAWVPSKTLADV